MKLSEAKEKFMELLMSLDTPPTIYQDSEGNTYLKIGENENNSNN